MYSRQPLSVVKVPIFLYLIFPKRPTIFMKNYWGSWDMSFDHLHNLARNFRSNTIIIWRYWIHLKPFRKVIILAARHLVWRFLFQLYSSRVCKCFIFNININNSNFRFLTITSCSKNIFGVQCRHSRSKFYFYK